MFFYYSHVRRQPPSSSLYKVHSPPFMSTHAPFAGGALDRHELAGTWMVLLVMVPAPCWHPHYACWACLSVHYIRPADCCMSTVHYPHPLCLLFTSFRTMPVPRTTASILISSHLPLLFSFWTIMLPSDNVDNGAEHLRLLLHFKDARCQAPSPTLFVYVQGSTNLGRFRW